MAAKPADFFIGVADLFAIVLPGALLSYLSLRVATPKLVNTIPNAGAQGWVAFALSSYLLGHFASLIGAFFLDPLYDITYLKIFKNKVDADAVYKEVSKFKYPLFKGATKNPTNYKWARASLRARHANAMQEIDRLEADSKFFRSVTVVLLILACGVACEILWNPGFLCKASSAEKTWGVVLWLVSVPLSFWRFSNLRWKAGEAAYLALVALEARLSNRTSEGKGALRIS